MSYYDDEEDDKTELRFMAVVFGIWVFVILVLPLLLNFGIL